MKIKFEWDEKKSLENEKKHGLRFDDVLEAFIDKKRVILEDIGHSNREDRFYCIGSCKLGVVTLRFTHRNKIIRIFGAGKWRKGKKIYEKQNKKTRI